MAEFDFQVSLTDITKDDGTENTAVVPKEIVGLYVKDGDKYVINPSLGKKLDTSGLTSALEKERKANRDHAKTVGAYKALGTIEELQAKLDAANAAGDDAGAKKFEKRLAEVTAAHKKELEGATGETTKMRSALDKYLIDAEATSALAEAKGSPVLLLPHVRSRVKVFEDNGNFVARVVDAEGDPRGDGKGGYMSVKDLITEMRKAPEYARAFESSGTSGSGTQPGGSKGKSGGQGNMSSTDKIAAGLAARRG